MDGPSSLSTPHAVATLQLHGEDGGDKPDPTIKSPPFHQALLALIEFPYPNNREVSIAWLSRHKFYQMLGSVCDYIGIAMEGATTNSPP